MHVYMYMLHISCQLMIIGTIMGLKGARWIVGKCVLHDLYSDKIMN